MIRSLRGSRQTRKTVRRAVSGAAMSLALAALSPGAQAIPLFCDDDLGHDNFTCGDQASTTGTLSTAVGDTAVAASGATAIGAQVAAASGATAIGSRVSAAAGGTAVGALAFAESSGVAVGSGAAVLGTGGTAL